MKDQFYLHFDTMPTGTHQQKGVRIVHGKPMFYEKASVKDARTQFTLALKPYAPEQPSKKPIRLTVWFAFDVKDKKLWGQYKPTRPDTDNSLKLLKDCMSGMFYVDDAQVVDEQVIKTYAEKATIMIRWEELYGKEIENGKP